ncbi:MAG: hypothetical protein NC930_08785 [Candidatus Omnitrophica bacterium]|nr:hypothetical protein [Candidatus Omnitrophota bacterium]
MSEPSILAVEKSFPEAEILPFQAPRRYEDQDFQFLYEQEYAAHQETKRRLRAAEDEIAYLKRRLETLEADNAYLRKLLFSKKTEKRGRIIPGTESSEADGPKTHGAQKGHKGHGRSIPFHLGMQDHQHFMDPGDCYCPRCGLPFKE